MRGGPLSLFGVVVCLTNVGIVAYGLIGSGIECNTPSMVFRVGGIGINVIANNGQATDPVQFTSLGVDSTRYPTVAVASELLTGSAAPSGPSTPVLEPR
jgi:hypothetical protein